LNKLNSTAVAVFSTFLQVVHEYNRGSTRVLQHSTAVSREYKYQKI